MSRKELRRAIRGLIELLRRAGRGTHSPGATPGGPARFQSIMRTHSSGQPVELEIKFNLPTGSITALDSHPALQSAAETQQTRHEVTTYFDTQSRQLSQLGASLRVRRWGNTMCADTEAAGQQGPIWAQ